jgi:hypothetical protein
MGLFFEFSTSKALAEERIICCTWASFAERSMAGWYDVSCRYCGGDIHVHEDWADVPEYHKECAWYEESCEICGGALRIHRAWDNPPRVHKECRDAARAKWYERPCKHCGLPVRIHQEWDNAPEYHKECAWHEEPCSICGRSMRIHRGWDNPPKAHKECKAAEAAKWYERACKHCGRTIRVHRDWENQPDYHNECAWYEKTCDICDRAMRLHRAWTNPPRSHKECFERFAPKNVTCRDCGRDFTIPTGLQIRCHKEGWDLPVRCQNCKHDALLIKGAIGALRDQFPFALETTIEQRGLIFTDKVAIVRSRKTGEVVAEVKMNEEGLLSVTRVAVATLAKSGELISKTRDAEEGILFPRSVADTYDSGNQKTHRSKTVDKGVFFRKRVTETRSTSDATGSPSVTTTRKKGLFYPKDVADTDKKT